VPSIDDVKEFSHTIQAMDVVGINKEEQHDCWKIISGIMKMSRIELTENRQEQAQMVQLFYKYYSPFLIFFKFNSFYII
jgi:myosin heavy subunit